MAVTELALLRLKPTTSIEDPELKEKLVKAKHAMQDYSGKTFYYLQQVEDPACIYILGEWESLSQHYDGYIPSKANQDILQELKDEIEVSWLSHLDVSIAEIQLGAPVLSLGRHMIKVEKRQEFEDCFGENRKHLDTFVTEGKAVGGWKLDDGRDIEEFVLFAPWKEIPQHMDFGKSEGFEEYFKIKDFIEKADIKHVRVVKHI